MANQNSSAPGKYLLFAGSVSLVIAGLCVLAIPAAFIIADGLWNILSLVFSIIPMGIAFFILGIALIYTANRANSRAR